VRYDVSALGASAAMPAATLLVRASDLPLDMTPLSPSWLAFDADGNLWADDFGANVVFRVAKADLSGSGEKTVTPPVRITLEVGALLEGLAFDEGGGLWVAYKQGKIARLDRSQLGTSSGTGAPTVPMTIISSSDIGNVSNVALWPAPAALPLFHALP
jgi:sugar lactone lactonase YvrE